MESAAVTTDHRPVGGCISSSRVVGGRADEDASSDKS